MCCGRKMMMGCSAFQQYHSTITIQSDSSPTTGQKSKGFLNRLKPYKHFVGNHVLIIFTNIFTLYLFYIFTKICVFKPFEPLITPIFCGLFIKVAKHFGSPCLGYLNECHTPYTFFIQWCLDINKPSTATLLLVSSISNSNGSSKNSNGVFPFYCIHWRSMGHATAIWRLKLPDN